MEGKSKQNRKTNPRDHASSFSKLTYLFTYDIFRKSFERDLVENDIYQIVRNCRANSLGNRLEKEWQRETQKSRPQFIVPILKIFGLEYLKLGVALMVVDTVLMVSKPLLVGKIVSYFVPGQTTLDLNRALLYCSALILCNLWKGIFMQWYLFRTQQLGLKIRAANCSLIYRKSLNLDTAVASKVANGRAVTLMTKDVLSFDFAMGLTNQMIVGVLQVVIMTTIMYQQVGTSALAGISLLIILLPFQAALGKAASKFKLKTANKTDERVQATQEVLTSIRIIKMYTWEPFFSKLITILRRKEVKNIKMLYYIKSLAFTIGHLSTTLALYICIMVYVSLGNYITAEKAFVVTGCFSSVRVIIMFFIPIGIAQLAELRASIHRITKFLKLEEAPRSPSTITSTPIVDPSIQMKDVSVPPILKNVNLSLKKGLTMISGQVGSGKSTLLKTILNDTKKTTGILEVAGQISYASQEPWIFPGTIRQNIVFGEAFERERYESVLKVCALKKDLEGFGEGDRTCVTDRGLNLSRGQKMRVNLARAVYKRADVYLLDDCLSAVDGNVGKVIFQECIKGFLKEALCLMVTHQAEYLIEADDVIVLEQGSVCYQGAYVGDAIFEKELEEEAEEEPEETSPLLKTEENFEKNIYAEAKQEGAVKKEVYVSYFRAGGFKLLLVVGLLAVVSQLVATSAEYFVSKWVDLEQSLSGLRHNGSTNTSDFEALETKHATVLKQYSFLIIGSSSSKLLYAFLYFIYCTNISNTIHKAMLDNILGASMTFFDVNLSGNILNRFTRDLGIIDDSLPFIIYECVVLAMLIFSIMILISIVNPIFLVPSAVFVVILFFVRRFYLPAGRSIRRLQGSTRSAVIGHLNASLEGLTTIRANKAQEILKIEFDKHQDLFNSTSFMHVSTSKAFGLYVDLLGVVYIAIISLTLILLQNGTLAGQVGLALTQALALTSFLNWGIQRWADLENEMTSPERALEYTKIEAEDRSGDKPPNWPLRGEVIYEDVNLRYSEDGDRILKDINFVIEPKNKIGIVGRTGAGKSSIIATLFRMYAYEGTIKIDDVDVKGVGLEFLRDSVSVIPQDPVLFAGSVRSNLDPKERYSDKELWDALSEVEMKCLVESLEDKVLEGGANFSIGQRQLICLARAIVRRNKIVVLDEATANMDSQTDDLIQATVRRIFAECTIIIIAHRLHTIMDCDKVLVMDSGSIIECDSPGALLKDTKGMFYKMATDSALKM